MSMKASPQILTKDDVRLLIEILRWLQEDREAHKRFEKWRRMRKRRVGG